MNSPLSHAAKAFLMCLTILLSSCAVVPLGLEASSTPMQSFDGKPRAYQILGKAEGSSGYFSLFGLIPFGEIDMKMAMDETARKNGGDALINVRYWVRSSNYLIGTYSNFEVQGDVIKFVK